MLDVSQRSFSVRFATDSEVKKSIYMINETGLEVYPLIKKYYDMKRQRESVE